MTPYERDPTTHWAVRRTEMERDFRRKQLVNLAQERRTTPSFWTRLAVVLVTALRRPLERTAPTWRAEPVRADCPCMDGEM